MIYLYSVLALLLFEGCLILLVTNQKKSIQWIITASDELPEFDQGALRKFFDNSFDANLGWVRRPGTSGTEQGQHGAIRFHVDDTGSRANRFNRSEPVVAAFGDSYAFCRQVEDDETWQACLAERENFGVLNYGVGNYGVDQALLRFEQMSLPQSVKVVIMAFVPETICRVQSSWKHYLEFGNTFAFKPRFIIDSDDTLRLLPNPVQSIDDFNHLAGILPRVRQQDRFYRRKFRALQYRFPYTMSLLRNPLRQTALLCGVTWRSILRSLGLAGARTENLPFMLVMKANIRDAHALYRDDESRRLLSAILLRFKSQVEAQGRIPLLLVMPQLLDLKLSGDNSPYHDFYADLARQMPVIDTSETFRQFTLEELYINDQYGGHLSIAGNRIVSGLLADWLSENLTTPGQRG